jgi:hypothetical protein
METRRRQRVGLRRGDERGENNRQHSHKSTS